MSRNERIWRVKYQRPGGKARYEKFSRETEALKFIRGIERGYKVTEKQAERCRWLTAGTWVPPAEWYVLEVSNLRWVEVGSQEEEDAALRAKSRKPRADGGVVEPPGGPLADPYAGMRSEDDMTPEELADPDRDLTVEEAREIDREMEKYG